jgi:hypothetical protein
MTRPDLTRSSAQGLGAKSQYIRRDMSAALFKVCAILFVGIEAVASAAENPPLPLKVAGVSNYPVPEQKGGEQRIPEAGLGDRIAVTVTNLNQHEKDLAPPLSKLILYLDGYSLKGLNPITVNAPNNLLVFKLERGTTENWSSLLGRPHSYVKNVRVGVGTENTEVDRDDSAQLNLRIFYPLWLIWCSLGFLALLGFFLWLAVSSNIVRDSSPPKPPHGDRRPFSLGRCQMAVWFFIVIGSFVFIWLITGDTNTITQQALVLIGIGTGTALGAAAIDSNRRGLTDSELAELRPQEAKLEAVVTELKAKVQRLIDASVPAATTPAQELSDAKIALKESEAQLQVARDKIAKSEDGLSAPVSTGLVQDLLTDVGGIEFHRFQIVVWTIIMVFLFIVGVYQTLKMPEFSSTMLALMGISAGTYLGFKIPEKH